MQGQCIWAEDNQFLHSDYKDSPGADSDIPDALMHSVVKDSDLSLDCALGKLQSNPNVVSYSYRIRGIRSLIIEQLKDRL